MAIDINRESLLTLPQAAKRLPSSRPGRKLNVSTLWRWASSGVKGGVVLETVTIGGTRFTSTEALQRFSERCSAGQTAPPSPSPTKAREAQRRKAEAILDAVGI